jgi:hypothetical protein
LATNASGGSLTIQNGYNLTTTAATLSNAGAVTIGASSTLAGPTGAFAYSQSGGSTKLATGTLDPNTIQINGGTLTGSGTIVGNVTNGGTFTPGGDGTIGTVNIQGSYTQTSSGTLKIDVGGTTSGTDDQVNVTGAATLGGTLNVNIVNGFAPTRGSTLVTQVMTFGSRSGDFATKTTTGNPNIGFATHYTASQLDLFAAAPGTTVYWLGGNADFNTPADWSTGAVPGPSDVVYIGPGKTVSFTSGDNTRVTTLYVDGTLNVSGGTLSVGTSAGSSNLNLTNGGMLAGVGTITDSGTASWSGGAIAESATVNFNGASTINGNVALQGQATLGGSGSTTLSGGTLAIGGSPTLNFASVPFQWSGGQIDLLGNTLTNKGFVTITPAAGMQIAANTGYLGGTAQNLGGTFANQGAIVEQGSGSIGLADNVLLSNVGSYEFAADTGLVQGTSIGAASSGTILNAGLFIKSAGTGTSDIQNGLPFTNSGTVQVGTGTLDIDDATDESGGTLTEGIWYVVGTGALNLNGGAAVTTIAASVSVTLDGSTASFANLAGLATNDGTFTIKSGYNLITTSATFTNAGAVTIGASSTLKGTGSFTYIQTAGTTTLAGGVLDPAQLLAVQINGGTLTGSGTIQGSLTNSGTFTPGGDGTVGTVNITGGYTQTANGILKIDIAGNSPGQFDQVNVSGMTNPGGTLDVQTTGGFSPQLSQFFDVVTSTSFNGTFPTTHTSLTGSDSLSPYYIANYEPGG